LHTAQLALPEKPQEIAHQQDQQHRAKSYACATTRAPPAVAVVASTTTKDEYQNNH
jgi:hypothetical protein